MVQDTSPSPEMYLSKLKGDKCGGWGITDEESTNSDYSYDDLQECTIVWAVSVPGENEWSAEEDGGSESEKTHQASQPHKYPIPDAPHVGIQIKVSTIHTHLSLKLTLVTGLRFGCTRHAQSNRLGDIRRNSLFRTVRPFPVPLLSPTNLKPNQTSIHSELDRDSPLEVPTLHVLFFRPLDPLTSSTYPAADLEASQIRDELIAWIADEALAGDKDAAEWVLLASIARVYVLAGIPLTYFLTDLLQTI